MTKQIRPLGFTNSLQQLIWQGGNNSSVVAYLWGGGGGGGGFDRGSGGAGSGGGFSQYNFAINTGDILQIAVGGKGSAGGSGASLAPGGAGGASYLTAGVVFNSRTAPASPAVVPSTNGEYVGFLNTYGVWNTDTSSAIFDRTYTVNFPKSGIYTFLASCDNSGTVFFDGEAILSVDGYTSTYTTTRQIVAGNHTVRMLGTNTGGPGSFGLTIAGNVYSGGPGGAAGPSGSSGGGGGGGGATVLILNGEVVAVAGGGAGGGGAGQSNGDSAPGGQGQSGTVTSGAAGQSHPGDGGGGGGGGGGLRGGLGGAYRGGDSGAQAGSFGSSSSPGQESFDRTAAGTDNEYYSGSPGTGGGPAGNGTAGYAVFEFNVPGNFVHYEGTFRPAVPFVKINNEWKSPEVTWIKTEGTWKPLVGSYAPEFIKFPDNFGTPGRVCISVIDECSRSASTMQKSWNSFLSLHSGTPFYLLQPGGPSRGNLRVPANFTSTSGVGPIAVNRDGGSTSSRSDWFALCGLSAYPAGSVVEISIDNSGSMTTSTVSASYNYCLEQCNAAGLTVRTVGMSGENWIAPFI
jgi:hypothetical protein